MRTTIRMDDELYRRIKARAAAQGRPVAELITDAVRAALDNDPREATELAALPTYGGSGVLPGVDLSSNAAMREVMDGGEPFDALR
jgi:plasmid stability protein